VAKLQKKSLAESQEIRAILQGFWGYSKFRPLQEDIIQSVLQGKDTLALMPTGGGKSLTFQVPAMAMEGICLVVTPLIALMKDQVDRLEKRGIKALAIHSGLNRHELSVAFDNCMYGGVKFLYLSPERLKTELFQARVRDMKVNLIAVDEAHCISEWGYDFRPAYMEIHRLREVLPEVPLLALTATATPEVCDDIMTQLAFPEKRLLKKGFDRPNLAYVVRRTEDKQRELLHIVSSLPGSGIVYARNRKKCEELATLLQEEACPATFYHAGLKQDERDERQEQWTAGKIRVVVATNAFGMGIDKADVRFVIHMDLPDTPEAYFQEAGRAGRDEERAWAILLHGAADERVAKQRLEVAYPGIPKIRQVYHALGNYFQLPLGSGKGQQFDFEFGDFLHRYKMNALVVQSALGFLVREGYLAITEAMFNPSRIMFRAGRDELYGFQVRNPELDSFIRLLLRTYSGLFSTYVKIDEAQLSRRSAIPRKRIYDYLVQLSRNQVIHYIPRKKVPVITYLEERLDEQSLLISPERYNFRKQRSEKRLKEMLRYAGSDYHCRNQYLLAYFGQLRSPRCGRCDTCVGKEQVRPDSSLYIRIKEKVLSVVGNEAMELDDLVKACGGEADQVLSTLELMLEEGVLIRDRQLKLARRAGGVD